MEQNSQIFEFRPKFNVKSLIIVLIIIAVIIFLFPRLVGLEDAVRLLLKANKLFLVLAFLAKVLSFIGATWLLGTILSRLGYTLRFLDRFRISSIAAFTMHFLPIGTLGAGATDYYFLKKKGIEPGSILLTLILRPIFTYLSFLIIFLFGLILVPVYPHLPFSPRIVSAVIFVAIASGVIYLVYTYQHKEKFWRLWQRFFRFVNRILTRLKKRNLNETEIKEIFDDMYKGVGLFGGRKRDSAMAILAAITYWLGDILCLFFVMFSLGFMTHPGVLVFGYGVATLAGLISLIPGGIGVIEGSMALIFSGLGIPSALSVMAILVYRLFSFWIWIPIGLISYITLNHSVNKRQKSNI